MERVTLAIENLMDQIMYTEFTWIGIVEILIIAFISYQVVLWIKNTKAWMLLKGIVTIIIFILIAELFEMTTLLYLVEVSMNVLALTAVVVFQPEIRRALESLGQKNLLSSIKPFDNKKDDAKFTEETESGIVDACVMMSKVKTGALIVIEKSVRLSEYENTGIELDCLVSSQILVNIFEHNTPLHDGAVIIRRDRIASATCYLPLSDNMNLSKKLGTRHRAAVGMSEASDALIIVVSEETGNISIADGGVLSVAVTASELHEYLSDIRTVKVEQRKTSLIQRILKGGEDAE